MWLSGYGFMVYKGILRFQVLLNYLSLLLSKACLIFEQFISTSTFKSCDSLSSTEENITQQKLHGRKSESDKTGYYF